MNLPRNAYTRHAARGAGALLCKADHCGYTRMRTKAAPEGYWLLDDPDRYVYRAAIREARAHAWRRALWCPVAIGDGLETAELTLRSLAWSFAGLGLVPAACLLAVGAAVYGLMFVGAAVLR